ncbi:MAG: HEAT repeat domain-containing protein, partial [Gemmatimonadales bacterium]
MYKPCLVASITALLLLGSTATPMPAQEHHPDYDEVDPWVGFQPPEPAADSSAVARFLAALAGSDPLVCQLAVSSIGNHWGPGDDDRQIGVLAGETRLSRERDALGRSITDPAALTLLSSTLSVPNPCVRRAAARLLGNSGTNEAVRGLRAALQSKDPRVREAGALGLADAEDPASLHDLTQALKDSDQSVIRMAAYALGELEDARAVKPLGDLLGSKDAPTRATAAWALGQIEDIRSAQRLT